MDAKGRHSDSHLNLASLRKDYSRDGLTESQVEPNPIRQFEIWFEQAQSAGLGEPNAMVLATADKTGIPSTRVVLLKEVSEAGFAFFTNYLSRKGRELAENPNASVTFPWVELERQVCIVGSIQKLSRANSEAYFKVRPRGSQLGAWVSQQSSVIPGRGYLEERLRELEQQYANQDVPLPPNWGGYLLAPSQIEFWQGRPNRLHDRLRYSRQANGSWKLERLSP